MTPAPSVKIGDTEYKLRPFKAFKAMVAGDLISNVGDEIRQVLGEVKVYEREYGKENVVRFTKAQTDLRGWVFSDDAFVTNAGEEPYIDLPGVPTDQEKWMFVFPRAFKLAKDEVAKLLALVVVPDQELAAAEGAGDIDTPLANLGRKIIHEAEIGEMIELISATIEHVQAQLTQHGVAVGKIREAYRSWTASAEEPPDERKTTVEPMRVISASPDSSTPLPTPTDGDETTSSTELTGASSST